MEIIPRSRGWLHSGMHKLPEESHHTGTPGQCLPLWHKNIMEMLGAFPIPNKLGGMKNFLGELENYIGTGHPVFIYPEAHIWPYYTRIRPFNESSFRYPVIYDSPAFSFTITYQKHLFRTKITIYIDGPFYPDTTINPRQAAVKLRNQVHDAMMARSENSTYEKVEYIKNK